MNIQTTSIHRILEEFQSGWAAGSGTGFAAPFNSRAHFVAFDGSVLTGQSEIADFHQRAFDTHLRDTALDLHIEEIRPIAPDIALVFASGGIRKTDGSIVERTGESVQVFVFANAMALPPLSRFKNTRFRPITDKQSAEVWRQFDELWKNRNRHAA